MKHNVLQNWILGVEHVDLVASCAFKPTLVDISLIVLAAKRHIAILATGLEALWALHDVHLDHHAQGALVIFRETVQQEFIV
jgi:hypothetical protein